LDLSIFMKNRRRIVTVAKICVIAKFLVVSYAHSAIIYRFLLLQLIFFFHVDYCFPLCAIKLLAHELHIKTESVDLSPR